MNGVARASRDRCVVPDESYVERVRRGVRSFDRWRWPLIAFYGLILTAFIVFEVAVIRRLGTAISNLEGRVSPAFSLGLVMGLGLGVPFLGALHGFFFVLLPKQRTERLLVAYHDAFEALRQDRIAGLPPASRR